MGFNAGDIESKLDLDRDPFNKSLDEALVRAKRIEKRRITMKLHLDRSELDALIEKQKGKGVTIPVDERQLKSYLDHLKQTEAKTNSSTNRMRGYWLRNLFSPVGVQFALLPGIALAATALAAVALGALPLAIAGIGIAALKNNQIVKESFAETWRQVQLGVTKHAEPLIPFFAKISENIRKTWFDLAPELDSLFLGAGPAVETFANGLLDLVRNLMPQWSQAILRSGPIMRGWQSLLGSMGTGLGNFVEEASHDTVQMGKAISTLGDLINVLLTRTGQFTSQFGGAWATVGPEVVHILDQLLGAVLKLTDGGLGAFGITLNVTLTLLSGILNIVQPLIAGFGGMLGTVIGLAAAWKLFGSTLGIVTRTFNALRPSAWVTKMGPATAALDRFGNSASVMFTKVGGSEKAAAGFTGFFTKSVSAVAKGISFLPLLGSVVLAAKGAIDDWFPSAEKLAPAIMKGGAAAEEAKSHIYGLSEGYQKGSIWAELFGTRADEVNAQIRAQRDAMTPLERAQADLVKSQNDYAYAVDKFGANSPQAVAAQHALAAATSDVEYRQFQAARATEDHTRAVQRQTEEMLLAIGSRLDYKDALLSLEKKQKDLNDALKKHGPASMEARQASVDYERGLLDVVQAIGTRVAAENNSLAPSERSRLATLAMHQEIARLAVAAGKNLPPALAEMAASLSDAELKALGVTKQTDTLGRTIYTLPPGKTLSFPTDAPVAQQQIRNLHVEVDALPTQKNLKYLISVVTNQSGSLPPNTGLGGLLGLPGRARGGPVSMGNLYRVNETGREYFQPAMNGVVLTAERTARNIASGWAGRDYQAVATAAPAGVDYEAIAAYTEDGVRRGIDGARLRVDGTEWARLVNTTNLRNSRR